MEKIDKLSHEEVINEINRLAKIKRIRELTFEESQYRESLKGKYIKTFRQGFEQQLKSIQIVDATNDNITSKTKNKGKENNDK